MDSTPYFLHRLRSQPTADILPVIAEIKAYTPAAGDLLRGRPVEAIAERYQAAGVACVSVVTGRWFGGSPALLQRVASTISLPILRKDFIASRIAIEQSRALGAAAVLLTRKLLTAASLMQLAGQALMCGLTPLVEIASASELEGLRLDQDAVLAINNRDISARETDSGDIGKSLTLLAAARTSGAGAIVSASAISTPGQARQLLAVGFDGLLIGTALLQTPDLDACLADFRVALMEGKPC